MISTTKDILFLVLAICSTSITIFLCWALFYLLKSLQDLRKITKASKQKFEAIMNFFDHTKNKMESTATVATAVSKAAVEVVKYVKEKRSNKSVDLEK